MIRRAFVPCLLSACAVFSLSPRAEACGPPMPGLTDSTPKNGETYPANAALFFYGYNIALDAVTVTVDGQPATLTPAAGTLSKAATLAANIDPKPSAGQTVVIGGNFCPNDGCQATTIQFTTGADDTEAPPLTELSAFNVYDYPDYKSGGGDCTIDSDLAWFFKLTAAPLVPGESPRVYSIERSPDANFTSGSVVHTSFVLDTAFPVIHRDMAVALSGSSPPEAFCFRVSTTDAAGNLAGTSPVLCKPCYYRAESGNAPLSEPGEPKWTAADAYPGGTCAMGGTGGGGAGNVGDDEAAEGCGCSAAGSEAPMAGAFAGLLLAMAAAARRRRARP